MTTHHYGGPSAPEIGRGLEKEVCERLGRLEAALDGIQQGLAEVRTALVEVKASPPPKDEALRGIEEGLALLRDEVRSYQQARSEPRWWKRWLWKFWG